MYLKSLAFSLRLDELLHLRIHGLALGSQSSESKYDPDGEHFSSFQKMFCRQLHSLHTFTILDLKPRFTWRHDSVSSSASGPSPPRSWPRPSRSSPSSKPPARRISSADSRPRASSGRKKRRADIEGGAVGRQRQHRLPPPSCRQHLNLLFMRIWTSTCHSSRGEQEARPAACSSTG